MNRFFHEDLHDLKAAGYLTAALPKDFGGLDLSLTEVLQEQGVPATREDPTNWTNP